MQKKSETIQGFLLVLPSIIALIVFIYGFIGWTVRVSMSEWTGLLPNYTWAGLDNYISLIYDPRFQIDLRNTIIFTTCFVGGSLLLGLFMATLLDQGIRGENFFRSVFLFPMAVSYIVTGVVWRWLLNPAMGSRISGFNLLFQNLHLDFLINQWHNTPIWGIAYIAIPAIWQMSGYAMAIYLVGIRSINNELREAARVDGANEIQIYRYIILPILKPVTFSVIIILGHMSLKVFDLIVAVVGKQLPLDVPAIYMWQATFDGLFFGRGAAIGIILLVSVALLIIPYLQYSLKNEVQI
ncbi:MAG: sugar ABC transporter permease [Anaerolineae bacterium]|nr:sugar ABC transporter permease [Anaerolineae bacterium]